LRWGKREGRRSDKKAASSVQQMKIQYVLERGGEKEKKKREKKSCVCGEGEGKREGEKEKGKGKIIHTRSNWLYQMDAV